jgi:uncharacterized membrane protein
MHQTGALLQGGSLPHCECWVDTRLSRRGNLGASPFTEKESPAVSETQPVEKGQVTEWPQSLVYALYDNLTGAAEALEKVQTAHEDWLITNENSAVIVKDAAGNVTFEETEDLSGLEGAKNGVLLGGLVGMLTPGTSMWTMAAKAGAWLGLGGRMHDAGFEDDVLRTVAASMPPNSSALIALVTHQWTDDLLRFLDETATKVGWVVVTEAMGNAVARAQGRERA